MPKGGPRSTSFKPGNTFGKGRPKGVPNRTTREIREFARSVLEQPEYREHVESLARRGKLRPHLETLLYGYAYGKPRERAEDDMPAEFTLTIGTPASRRTAEAPMSEDLPARQ